MPQQKRKIVSELEKGKTAVNWKTNPKSDLAKKKSLVLNECAEYHFNHPCLRIRCKTEEELNKNRCCILCANETCEYFRQCKYFDTVILSLVEYRAKKK